MSLFFFCAGQKYNSIFDLRSDFVFSVSCLTYIFSNLQLCFIVIRSEFSSGCVGNQPRCWILLCCELNVPPEVVIVIFGFHICSSILLKRNVTDVLQCLTVEGTAARFSERKTFKKTKWSRSAKPVSQTTGLYTWKVRRVLYESLM